ncbi:hypothetical protein [Paenibacillus sp. MER TA 81-3]|uniref:hypothetical protein n=1 Tax=Paenibacillus sp. MER TA 81-3 TaxID=2939573 RepID=UPI002559B2AB|nr:hypothetical protein [Paenibacillus sp. MER TA 81-3]
MKPFSIHELKARIKAHLHREQCSHLDHQPKLLHQGDLTLDLYSLQLFIETFRFR